MSDDNNNLDDLLAQFQPSKDALKKRFEYEI